MCFTSARAVRRDLKSPITACLRCVGVIETFRTRAWWIDIIVPPFNPMELRAAAAAALAAAVHMLLSHWATTVAIDPGSEIVDDPFCVGVTTMYLVFVSPAAQYSFPEAGVRPGLAIQSITREAAVEPTRDTGT